MDQWPEDRVWQCIRDERQRLATDLNDLDEASWTRPTLCGEWTVEDVVAHLTAAANIGRWRWVRSVLGARFDFDLHNARRLEEFRGSDHAGTLDNFRHSCTLRIQPARPTWAWLGEVIVHSADIRISLGIATLPDQATVDYLAACFAEKNFTVPSRDNAKGMTLISTDGDFRHGDGPTVLGRSIDLVLAMAGRPAAVERLSGEGLETMTQRLG